MKKLLPTSVFFIAILYTALAFAANNGVFMVVSSEGAVLVKPASSDRWIEAKAGLWLKTGDIIKTGLDGKVYIQFSEKIGFTLMPNSQIMAGAGPLIAEPYTEPPSQASADRTDNIYAPAVAPESKASSV